MIKKILLLSLVVIGCGGSSSSRHVDLAAYALLHPEFPCEEFKEAVSSLDSYSVGVLWNTFGTDSSCLKTIIKDPRLDALILYGANAVCSRNNNCGRYEFLASFSPDRERAAIENKNSSFLSMYQLSLQRLANTLYLDLHLPDGLNLIVFPELESNLAPAAHDVLVRMSREVFPTALIGYNPVDITTRGEGGTHDILSIHRMTHSGERCIANNDGKTISGFGHNWNGMFLEAAAVKDYLTVENCEYSFVWHAQLSNFLPEGPFVDPRDREAYSGTWARFVSEFTRM